MSETFERTRQTAQEAAANGRLLRAASEGRLTVMMQERLAALAARYEEYADALLASILADYDPDADDDQVPLL